MRSKLLGILCLCSFFVACGKTPEKTMDPIKEVEAGFVELGTARITVETFGHVRSSNSAQIVGQATGQVLAYHFKEGDCVKKDDLLYTIDPTIYQANYDKAVADREQQEALLSYAKQTVTRYEHLVKNDYVAQLEYDKYVTDMKSNEALFKEAQANEIAQRAYLNYCFVKAPFEGRAGKRLVDIGSLVTEFQTPMVEINQMDPIYVDFSLPQKHFEKVFQNQKQKPLLVSVYFSDENKKFNGELVFIDNAVNTETGGFALRSQFLNTEEKLWPGAYLRVELLLEEIPNTTLCPATAVQLGASNKWYVLVINKESKIEKRVIELGMKSGDHYIITQGISPGEMVVTQNVVYVNPGSTVKAKT